MDTNIKATKTITATFYVHHTPANDQHLAMILKNYFQAKGVRTEQEYDGEGKPIHDLIIQL